MKTLNCQTFRQALDQQDGIAVVANNDAMQAHLQSCASCQRTLERVNLLRQELKSQPVPPPPTGYEGRMLTLMRAHSTPATRSRRWHPAYAMAASLTLCAGVMFLLLSEPENQAASTALASTEVATPSTVKPVRLVIRSQRALSGVSMTVSIPADTELASHPDTRELTWTTDLQAGNNILVLPLRLRGTSGAVVATLRYGNAQRQYSVELGPVNQSNAFPLAPGPRAHPAGTVPALPPLASFLIFNHEVNHHA